MGDALGSQIDVVIVDDHRMFAESLARLLSDEDRIGVVGIAQNGNDAMDLVRRLQPRVVLIDFQMPGQDGVALTEIIKESHPEVTVVMLTASTDDRVLLSAMEAGCSGFLTKHRAAEEVAEAVRVAASGDAVISPALLARLLRRIKPAPPTVGSILTDREREVLDGLAKGWTNKMIAAELFLSVNTIRNYVQSVLSKLEAHSKLQAVSIAVRAGILDYPVDG